MNIPTSQLPYLPKSTPTPSFGNRFTTTCGLRRQSALKAVRLRDKLREEKPSISSLPRPSAISALLKLAG
jgi:hypothetical protein